MSADESDDPGTTKPDYRWQWLSTLWALGYGFGFPLWVAWAAWAAGGPGVSAPVMAALLGAWGGTVVYIIGPEAIDAWQQFRDGGEA